ncbi:MAG TPA: hypothetical protein DCO79_13190, partial [Spirochaeta sp.]|nr:hypothetical protein [Spirochaeta sp.]
VSLKKKFPELDITASDRDALALRFTEMNIKLNKLGKDGIRTAAGLLPGSLKSPVEGESKLYDLIISNIPAKAGNPVIRDFLQNCGMHLTEKGRAAVVIVEPLADFAGDCLKKSGAEILYKEADKQYTVFHFKPNRNVSPMTFASIYKRNESRISGFHGLPEFDSISYRTKVVLEMLESHSGSGRTLIWNPGIGYIPNACKSAGEILTAGPDMLQLKASDYNSTAGCLHFHLPVFSALEDVIEGELDYIIAAPDFVSRAAVGEEVLETSLGLLRMKGKILAAGKSSDIARIEKSSKGYTIRHSIKYRGFRSLLLEKID